MKRNDMKKRLCMALCALFSVQSKNADAFKPMQEQEGKHVVEQYFNKLLLGAAKEESILGAAKEESIYGDSEPYCGNSFEKANEITNECDPIFSDELEKHEYKVKKLPESAFLDVDTDIIDVPDRASSYFAPVNYLNYCKINEINDRAYNDDWSTPSDDEVIEGPTRENYRTKFNKELKKISEIVKKEYNINLEYDGEFVDLLSQKCVEKDAGYRSMVFYKQLIKSAIESKYRVNSLLLNSVSKFKLDFDEDEDTIICRIAKNR